MHQVTALSSPVKAFRSMLTVFEPDMKLVKTKIYRTLRLNAKHTNQMMVLGSNWTLMSPTGDFGVCINGHEHSSKEKSYCIYDGISNKIPEVGKVLKGCKHSSYDVLTPVACEPIAEHTCNFRCKSWH